MSSVVSSINPQASDTSDTAKLLQQQFDLQHQAYLDDPVPDFRQRKQDLLTLKRMVNENLERLLEAINKDYGNRSRHESLLAEIIPVTDGINGTLKHLKKWMKVQRRHIDRTLYFGAKNRVIPQPLGVIGLIIPWNFPLNLMMSKLTCVFAAGNRAMVKMSENSIALTRLLQELSPKYFPPEKLQFFEETGSVGIEFSQIPFDLMIFTGSGRTGRAVMASAARNLTPVILELGGKSPAIIDPDYPLDKAVDRIMFAKQFNAGQICTNVDYVFVDESQKDDFIAKASAYAQKHCPDINHPDYTSIIDDRSYERLEATLEDARSKGAAVINLCGEQVGNRAQRKFPLHVVTDTTPDMLIEQREIFGPLLLVFPYQSPDEAIDYINAHDRPLALYPFTNKRKLAEHYIERIMSGGVSVNDALYHYTQHDLPFGGVGPSGMGQYHGYEGFLACSKLRPVFYQARSTSMKLLAPPYGSFATRVFNLLTKLKN